MAWLLLPYPGARETRHERDSGDPDAMLLTTLITLLFIGVSSVILWLSIGAE